MKRSFQLKILLLFGLVSVILVGVTGSAHRAQLRNVEDHIWVAHTYRVLDVLDDLFSNIKEAEARQRSFIITGRAEALSAYYENLPQVHSDISLLKRLTGDNPPQQAKIIQLEKLTQERLSILQSGLDLRQEKGFIAAQQLILNGQGTRLSEEISRIYHQIKAEENRLLQVRLNSANASFSTAQAAGSLGTFSIFTVLALIFYMVQYEMLRRQKAEDRLREVHLHDERRMEEMESLRKELSQLNHLTELLQNCLSLEEAFTVISQTVQPWFPRDSGAIGLINASKNYVEVQLTWGDKPLTAPVYAPEACWGLRRGRTHCYTDPAQDLLCAHISEALSHNDNSLSPEEDLADTDFLCQPMLAHGNTLGVFQLVRFGCPWTDREKMLAITLGELIAVALANLQLQEALKVQSIQDPLTGLYNRRFMEASLEQELARSVRSGKPVGVIMLDIDHFKRFNDTYGHDAGDALLAQVGVTLQSATRKEDIVCRYGGEEFLIILGQSCLGDTRHRAEELRQEIQKISIQYRGENLGSVTLSLGVAGLPEHGETPEQLIRAADGALYIAKHNGRDQVVVADEGSMESARESTPQ
jgi:diguanylate cyclase (GGDEF)-like protein